MNTAEAAQHGSRFAIVAVVALALALRAALIVAGSGQFDDPDNYLPLARSVAEGDGLSWKSRPTAYRPPLYPILLAPLIRTFGERRLAAIGVFHLALGGATVWLAYVAARRWGLSESRCLIAAFLTACDPVLAWQTRFVMTETLGAFLVILSLAELARPGRAGAISGGLALGLAALCRPSLLPGAGLMILAAPLTMAGPVRDRLRNAALIGASLAFTLAPWAIRNAIVIGEPVLTTTHGGYTLALGNNETYYKDVLLGGPGRVWTGDDQWRWWDSVNRETAGMTEPRADRFLRDRVIRLAIDQPGLFLRSCADRLARFWSASPATAVYSSRSRWLTIAWTVPFWAAVIAGLCNRSLWRWPRVAAPLAVIGLTCVHAFYWTDLRMRAPIVPALALIAASAMSSRGNSHETVAGSQNA